jgi:hypothetical protein
MLSRFVCVYFGYITRGGAGGALAGCYAPTYKCAFFPTHTPVRDMGWSLGGRTFTPAEAIHHQPEYDGPQPFPEPLDSRHSRASSPPPPAYLHIFHMEIHMIFRLFFPSKNNTLGNLQPLAVISTPSARFRSPSSPEYPICLSCCVHVSQFMSSSPLPSKQSSSPICTCAVSDQFQSLARCWSNR